MASHDEVIVCSAIHDVGDFVEVRFEHADHRKQADVRLIFTDPEVIKQFAVGKAYTLKLKERLN